MSNPTVTRVRNRIVLTRPPKLNLNQAFDRMAPGNHSRISRASGVSLQHVSRVLRGVRGCSLHMAGRIARGAGVTVDQLMAYRASNGTQADKPHASTRQYKNRAAA